MCVCIQHACDCVSVWQERRIGLYLGKQNINKQRRRKRSHACPLSPSFMHTYTLAAWRWVVCEGWRAFAGTHCVAFLCVAPQVAKQGVEKWAAPSQARIDHPNTSFISSSPRVFILLLSSSFVSSPHCLHSLFYILHLSSTCFLNFYYLSVLTSCF